MRALSYFFCRESLLVCLGSATTDARRPRVLVPVLCRQFFKWSSALACTPLSSWPFFFFFSFRAKYHARVSAMVVAPHVVKYAPSCPRTTFGTGLDFCFVCIFYFFYFCFVQKFRAISSPVVRVEQLHSCLWVFFLHFVEAAYSGTSPLSTQYHCVVCSYLISFRVACSHRGVDLDSVERKLDSKFEENTTYLVHLWHHTPYLSSPNRP